MPGPGPVRHTMFIKNTRREVTIYHAVWALARFIEAGMKDAIKDPEP